MFLLEIDRLRKSRAAAACQRGIKAGKKGRERGETKKCLYTIDRKATAAFSSPMEERGERHFMDRKHEMAGRERRKRERERKRDGERRIKWSGVIDGNMASEAIPRSRFCHNNPRLFISCPAIIHHTILNPIPQRMLQASLSGPLKTSSQFQLQ